LLIYSDYRPPPPPPTTTTTTTMIEIHVQQHRRLKQSWSSLLFYFVLHNKYTATLSQSSIKGINRYRVAIGIAYWLGL
jgi:hypothetical protein